MSEALRREEKGVRGWSAKGVQKGKRERVAPGVKQTYLTRGQGLTPV